MMEKEFKIEQNIKIYYINIYEKIDILLNYFLLIYNIYI